MRLGDLDALKEDLKHRLEIAKTWKEDALNNGHDEIAIRAEATIDFICEVIMTIDNAPTVESNEDLKTKPVVIVDDLGQSIRGYYDPARKLIYTGYGIVSSRWLNDKKYKMISQPEDSEVKDGGKVE